jgi:uncharacterized repeat protein (TIGR03803 family)
MGSLIEQGEAAMHTPLRLAFLVGTASACVAAGAQPGPTPRGALSAASAYETQAFPANRKYGGVPDSRLVVLPDGTAFGAALNGGKGLKDGSNGGTIYRIAPDRTFTAIHHFTYAGAHQLLGPVGVTLGADGNLYGLAREGGKGCGGAFRMTTAGKAYKVLHVFNCAKEGTPNAFTWLTQAADGNFYGNTQTTSGQGYGTVFKMTPAGAVTVIHTFVDADQDGKGPLGGLTLASNGAFYGTTQTGNDTAFGGTIFRIAPGDMYEVVFRFPVDQQIGGPRSPPVERDGSLYGSAMGGTDVPYAGVIYSIDLDGSNYRIAHEFDGATDGDSPVAPLYLALDGRLYGTTTGGGAHDLGGLFSIAADETFASLRDFGDDPGDGRNSEAGLVQLPDGTLVGSTFGGGAAGFGTTFWYLP